MSTWKHAHFERYTHIHTHFEGLKPRLTDTSETAKEEVEEETEELREIQKRSTRLKRQRGGKKTYGLNYICSAWWSMKNCHDWSVFFFFYQPYFCQTFLELFLNTKHKSFGGLTEQNKPLLCFFNTWKLKSWDINDGRKKKKVIAVNTQETRMWAKTISYR